MTNAKSKPSSIAPKRADQRSSSGQTGGASAESGLVTMTAGAVSLGLSMLKQREAEAATSPNDSTAATGHLQAGSDLAEQSPSQATVAEKTATVQAGSEGSAAAVAATAIDATAEIATVAEQGIQQDHDSGVQSPADTGDADSEAAVPQAASAETGADHTQVITSGEGGETPSAQAADQLPEAIPANHEESGQQIAPDPGADIEAAMAEQTDPADAADSVGATDISALQNDDNGGGDTVARATAGKEAGVGEADKIIPDAIGAPTETDSSVADSVVELTAPVATVTNSLTQTADVVLGEGGLTDGVVEALTETVESVSETLTDGVSGLTDGLEVATTALTGMVGDTVETVTDTVVTTVLSLTAQLDDVTDAVEDITAATTDIVGGVGDLLDNAKVTLAESPTEAVSDIVAGSLTTITSAVDDVGDVVLGGNGLLGNLLSTDTELAETDTGEAVASEIIVDRASLGPDIFASISEGLGTQSGLLGLFTPVVGLIGQPVLDSNSAPDVDDANGLLLHGLI